MLDLHILRNGLIACCVQVTNVIDCPFSLALSQTFNLTPSHLSRLFGEFVTLFWFVRSFCYKRVESFRAEIVETTFRSRFRFLKYPLLKKSFLFGYPKYKQSFLFVSRLSENILFLKKSFLFGYPKYKSYFFLFPGKISQSIPKYPKI